MEQSAWPELYCPFPPALSPHAEAVHKATVEWACRFGLAAGVSALRQIEASRIGFLAGRFHPEAPPKELQLVSDWYVWMFIRDDQCDDSKIGEHPERLAARDSEFLEILKGEKFPDRDEPLARALFDLRRRLLSKAPSDAWMRRFVRTVEEHFDSTLWESANRARSITPDVASYVRMRPLTAGLAIDTALIEVVNKIPLPPEVLEHPFVRSLTSASNNVVCYSNDLFSLEKELRSGDVHNLVLVLQHAHGIALREAVDLAAVMHDAEVQAFIDLEADLPSFGPVVDTKLGRYVAALRTRMRGHLDWSLESGRYRKLAAAGDAGTSPVALTS